MREEAGQVPRLHTSKGYEGGERTRHRSGDDDGAEIGGRRKSRGEDIKNEGRSVKIVQRSLLGDNKDGKPSHRRRRRSSSSSYDRHRNHGRRTHHEGSHGHRRRSHSPRRPREELYRHKDREAHHRQHRRHHSIGHSSSHSFSSVSPSQRRCHPKSPSLPPASTTVASLPHKRSTNPLPSQHSAYNANNDSISDTAVSPTIQKQKPSLAPSGKLAAETNTVAGTAIVLKYNEPPEARKPAASADWRLYEFKGGEQLGSVLQLGQRSCWLFGRERAIVDFPVEHPSCSKQHAVLQFRWVEKRDEFGERKGFVKPYVIDLDSANGTRVNRESIEGRRFVELRSGDVIVFGDSTREYVVLLSPQA